MDSNVIDKLNDFEQTIQKTDKKKIFNWKKNKILIILILLTIIIILTILFLIFCEPINKDDINFEISLIPNSDELKISNISKKLDKIIINIFFQKENNNPIRTYTLTNNENLIKNNSIIIKAYYGIPLIQIIFLKIFIV